VSLINLTTMIRDFSDKWKITKFKPTPIMSTYLLAFVIGDFKVAEVKSTRGVPVTSAQSP
jgi:aminopeptidase N